MHNDRIFILLFFSFLFILLLSWIWPAKAEILEYADLVLDIDMIESSQELTMSETGKYRAQALTDTDYYQYSIDEYVMPDGSPGYQLFYKDKTTGLIQSYGYGPEAGPRTYSIEFIPIKATSTYDIL